MGLSSCSTHRLPPNNLHTETISGSQAPRWIAQTVRVHTGFQCRVNAPGRFVLNIHVHMSELSLDFTTWFCYDFSCPNVAASPDRQVFSVVSRSRTPQSRLWRGIIIPWLWEARIASPEEFANAASTHTHPHSSTQLISLLSTFNSIVTLLQFINFCDVCYSDKSPIRMLSLWSRKGNGC